MGINVLSHEHNLRYLAGLFDGEGSAGIYTIQRTRYHGRLYKSKRYGVNEPYVFQSPVMQLCMTDIEPVQLLVDIFKTKIYVSQLPSGKTRYQVRVTHQNALRMARALYPFLINRSKRKQVGSVIQYYLDQHNKFRQVIRP